MKRIGITGTIGTGKSTIARIFEVLGVPVYHADKQAREIVGSEKARKDIIMLFGEKVIDAYGVIDRKALSAIVFSDQNKLFELNNLIHPLVEEDFRQWCALYPENKYIVHEAAILFESGFDRLFDSIILVTAPEELCIARVITRDGTTKESVVDRIHNQWSQEKKQQLAQYIIINDEISLVIPQVLAIQHKLLIS